MQKRNLYIGLALLVIVVAGVTFAVMNKSKTATTSTTTSSNSSSSNTNASTSAVVQTKTSSSAGTYLADANGNALYTYGADTAGVSNCTGSCLTAWPAYSAANAPATLPAHVTVITRSDSTKQYAYNDMPLYTFVSDSSGQATGDNVSNFHLARP